MPSIRNVDELRDVDDPAWPDLAAAADAAAGVDVLAAEAERSADVLYRLQVTARSTMGAMAIGCGGMLLDHGWLRLLGGGSGALPDLATANQLNDPRERTQPPSSIVMAIDVLGGRFAVNGGGLPGDPGEVCYWGPDTLRWEGLGVGHTGFVHGMLEGQSTEFYGHLRWTGWEREVSAVGLGEGLSLWPPPFSAEGKDLALVSRRPVPLGELASFYEDMAAQLDG